MIKDVLLERGWTPTLVAHADTVESAIAEAIDKESYLAQCQDRYESIKARTRGHMILKKTEPLIRGACYTYIFFLCEDRCKH
jgi:hypothetical protein